MSQGQKVRSRLDKFQAQARVGSRTHEKNPGEGTMPIADLPRKYKLKDPDWINLAEMKQQLIKNAEAAGAPEGMAMTRFGQVQLTDRDLRALQERKKVDVAKAFDGWFGENFNKADLPTRLLGEQLNPEYYKEREEAMVERAQMALRLELMKLYGPRSEEDLILIYGLQNNLIRLDKDSTSIVPSAYSADDEDERAFIFNTAISRFLLSDTQLDRRDRERLPGTRSNVQPFGRTEGTGRALGSFADLLDILN